MSSASRAACGLVFVSVMAATAPAQAIHPHYGIGGGLSIPTGDFHADANGDGYNAGWEGMALLGFKLPGQSAVGVRFDVTYGENAANDKLKADLTATVGAPTDSKVKLLGGTVDLTYEFGTSSPAKAYLLAGIGVYNTKLTVTSGNVTADTSKTKFTWNGGAGLSYGMRGAALFVEARYYNISSPFGGTDLRYIPIIAGVRFGGK
ncbi:MAG: hypothetical protein DMD42_08485 [Gemmatimonadetes bacterium]|nr:MAG: hypothetical protein DMD42_08485 [Gemmatimonadota bacterium]